MKIINRLKVNIFFVVSTLIVLIQMLIVSGGKILEITSVENSWLVLPYFMFFCITLIIKKTPAMNLSICITALLMLLFTLLFYMDTSSSSTACLIFICGPFYLLVGIPIFLGISFIIAKRIVQKRECKTQKNLCRRVQL
jgi:ABC-type proline/glycine betaine transport system permease subunit